MYSACTAVCGLIAAALAFGDGFLLKAFLMTHFRSSSLRVLIAALIVLLGYWAWRFGRYAVEMWGRGRG